MTTEPQPGDKRVRFGYVEVYRAEEEKPHLFTTGTYTDPAHWAKTDTVVQGAREVEIDFQSWDAGSSIKFLLAPNERVVSVDGDRYRRVWIERTLS